VLVLSLSRHWQQVCNAFEANCLGLGWIDANAKQAGLLLAVLAPFAWIWWTGGLGSK
jgi:hypothetical protein